LPQFICNTIQLHIAAFVGIDKIIKYLILHRSDKAYVYPSLWQVITGRIEEGETALEAALRELKEETGLVPEKLWTLPYVATYFETPKDIIHASPVFGIVVDHSAVIKISEEHQDYKWLDFDDCIECLLIPAHREGTRVFRDFVLNSAQPDLFRLD
jgi:dATP pyrophosphohydrolase